MAQKRVTMLKMYEPIVRQSWQPCLKLLQNCLDGFSKLLVPWRGLDGMSPQATASAKARFSTVCT